MLLWGFGLLVMSNRRKNQFHDLTSLAPTNATIVEAEEGGGVFGAVSRIIQVLFGKLLNIF